MSIPIRSMSSSRFSIEVNWIRVRRPCSRLTSRVRSLANWWRGCQSIVRPAPAIISSAFCVSRWQWMSIVNHLPRACSGPGKRPGICAPSGRQVNSIASPPRVSPILRICGRACEAAKRRSPLAEPARYRHIQPMQRVGGAMIGRARETIRKWTETARAAPVPGLPMVLDMLEWAYGRAIQGMPGLDGAEELAKSYAARYATTDEAVATLIASPSRKAGVAGFVTGCGGAIALPLAMPANLLGTLYIQLRLVAAIAHLRGHDLQSAEVRTLALACMTGSKAADTLKDALVRLRTQLTRDALGWLSPVLIKKVEHAARLPVRTSSGTAGVARLGRPIPVTRGGVAGGLDAAMSQLVRRTAHPVFAGPKASAGT